MATVTPVMDMLERGTLIKWTWNALRQSDTGGVVEWARLADRSVHIYGTWGGASVVMEGSNDGSNMCQLENLKGLPISVSANALFGILQLCCHIQPRVVGGDGTTNLTAILLSRK